MGVLCDTLSIVAMQSVESVFYTPRDKKLQAERARMQFFHDDGMLDKMKRDSWTDRQTNR